MTTRSTRLAAGQIGAPGSVTVYTCSPGQVVIVKSIHLTMNVVSVTVQAAITSPGNQLVFLINQAMTSTQFANWAGWHVLAAGDTVSLSFSGSAGLMSYWVSGTVLPSP